MDGAILQNLAQADTIEQKVDDKLSLDLETMKVSWAFEIGPQLHRLHPCHDVDWILPENLYRIKFIFDPQKDLLGETSVEIISDTKSLRDEYDELVLSAPSESDPLSSMDF
jgi:hypothetical protein